MRAANILRGLKTEVLTAIIDLYICTDENAYGNYY
jgi:hypothetical protein